MLNTESSMKKWICFDGAIDEISITLIDTGKLRQRLYLVLSQFEMVLFLDDAIL